MHLFGAVALIHVVVHGYLKLRIEHIRARTSLETMGFCNERLVRFFLSVFRWVRFTQFSLLKFPSILSPLPIP